MVLQGFGDICDSINEEIKKFTKAPIEFIWKD